MFKLSHSTQPVNNGISSCHIPKCVDPQEATTRITFASSVANCLDTLKVSFWINWTSLKFLKQLDEAKNAAQSLDLDSEPVDIAGHTFNCSRTGTKLFSYRLVMGDVVLLFSTRKVMHNKPNARLEIGSMSCWAPGFMHIYSEFIEFIEMIGGAVLKERVSEVHLCADFVGVSIRDLPVKDEEHWIAIAHNFVCRSNRRKFSTISWGSGDLMLRIYDKALELQKNDSKKQLFHDVWQLDPSEDTPVTRVEFQIRRPILNSFTPKINTLTDLIDTLHSLWEYCTSTWTRLADSPVDRNHHQSRAKTDLWWNEVQAVRWDGDKFIERRKEYARKDFDRISKMLAGLGMSAAALSVKNPDDVDGVVCFAHANLETNIRKMFMHDKDLFVKKMAKKMNEIKVPFKNQKNNDDSDHSGGEGDHEES